MLKLLRPIAREKRHIVMLDIIFAVLLLVATLSTAVCVYQATRWNGEQATDYGQSAQYRSESIRATTIANSQELVDIQVFLDWVNAASTGDLRQRAFLEDRFRPEFRPAFEAWKAGANATNPIPPGTPFDRPEYTLAKTTESVQLEEQAAVAFSNGEAANDYGDRYISNTVLFAIVLFFCGVYTQWEEVRIRQGILVVTLIVFTLALYSMGSLLLRVGYI
jgi:hypothetical protein